MEYSIDYGSRRILYTLLYTNRKTLGITVNPDMRIVVKAPENSSVDLVATKVRKRAAWIIKQQNFFLTFHPRPNDKKYVSGSLIFI